MRIINYFEWMTPLELFEMVDYLLKCGWMWVGVMRIKRSKYYVDLIMNNFTFDMMFNSVWKFHHPSSEESIYDVNILYRIDENEGGTGVTLIIWSGF